MLKDLRLTREKNKTKTKQKNEEKVLLFLVESLIEILLEFLDLFWTIGFRPDKTHLAESRQFFDHLSVSVSVSI